MSLLTIAVFSTLWCFTRNRYKKNDYSKIISRAHLPFIADFFKENIYTRKHEIEEPIVVIVPTYNNSKWYAYNFESIIKQNYKNYRVEFIADGCSCSTYDGTGELIEACILRSANPKKFTLTKNTKRHGALYNLYHAIQKCKDNDIVVTLDGDDWFYHDNVLSQINDIYRDHNVWVTHGRFIEYPKGGYNWSLPIPTEIVKANRFREYRCPSHLRTFRAGLFKKIKQEDLMKDGDFYSMTWDQAIMFPLFEMAGERHYYIESPFTYVYNVANNLNDCKVNAVLQHQLEEEIRSKPRYSKLP